jgi:hypothetical protein
LTYEDTWLWRAAFLDPRSDATPEEQTFFRTRYQTMREKAAHLVSRIGADMKHMTVHDITHLDALWEMGSIVAHERIPLNPPEAFVFGGAVLLHDAAMTLAAFDGGVEGLKHQVAWQDSFARLTVQAQDRGEVPDFDKFSALATAEALRRLHATQAEKLPTMSWQDQSGKSEFLIDDPEVRSFYGPKIGQIAHSHWWSVGQVEEELANDLGPLGGRTNCRIDLVKIASLLRVSDAMHLDRRRAPAFLAKLLQPEGISASHWAYQERMAVPFIEGEALIYSAAPAFELAHSEAWWLAYDAATMVDRELREVDHLLQRRGGGRLAANRVKAVGSPEDFSKHVETSGWVPVDSTVRVSDVPKIVATLGGSKLYGDDPKAAIRELIQNAADAIDARRRLQKRPEDWGGIAVGITESDDGYWLYVEDTGIGMSSAVLTGPLIDFGNSFWRSPFAAEEFPGIQAAGISATGRYGIGFFSVFMLGDRVRVISRRYDRGSESARTLEFMNGLGSRPVLYSPEFTNVPLDGGTRVEVLLRDAPGDEDSILGYLDVEENVHDALGRVVASIAPNLPVKISIVSESRTTDVILPKDWLSLPEKSFVSRLRCKIPDDKSSNAKKSRLRHLVASDGAIYGRATIATDLFGTPNSGCISVGGLRASEISSVRGILLGRESTASRNEAYVIAPTEVLKAWATEQAGLIAKADLYGGDKALAAQIVLHCGGDIGSLPVAKLNGDWLSESQLRKYVRTSDDELIVHAGTNVFYDEDEDDVHPREFQEEFQDQNGVIFVPERFPGYYRNQSDLEIFRFAEPKIDRENLMSIVRNMVEGLKPSGTDLIHVSRVVGTVNHTDIIRSVMACVVPDPEIPEVE